MPFLQIELDLNKAISKSRTSVFIKAKFFRLSHDVVTCDVDRDVSTAYC